MKLKPVQTYAPAELRGRIPGELHTAMTAYTADYRETIGQAIDVWPLVVQMVQQFVDTGREFQAWRRRRQNGSGPGPITNSRRGRRERAGSRRG